MPVAKSNMFSYNSTGVASSSSVRRPESKDNNLKKIVLLHTKSKSTSKDVKKSHSSVSLVSNKRDTLNFNVSESNENVIQIVLWIVDNGCSKHMTGNLKLLRNFVEKFIGTVRFGNDHFATITGYGDYVQGNLTICHVYYVEGLGHNLFSVRHFCDGDLEVAFRSNTCYVQNLEGEDLLTGSRDSNIYTISIFEMADLSPVFLISLYYPTNDRDDLGKIKPKVDIGIFIGYSESSRGFHIYNHKTRKIIETIHVKFDELTAMASECNNSGPGLNCLNFQDSSEELNEILSKEDLDTLFGPLYEEYYETRTPEVSYNSAVNTLDTEYTPSSSSIIFEDHEAPQIVSPSKELIANEPSTPVSYNHSNKPVQEDVAELDGNTLINPFGTPAFEEAESSSNY
ncbi:integrase, catalytic region, zinc finger, CCHC-type containing protein [Tanacetum coccineum]